MAVHQWVDSSDFLVLRKWNDDVSGETEFRVFVEDKKAVAISQQ